MVASNKLPTGFVSLLIESESGVTEFFMHAFEQDGMFGLRADRACTASGTFRPATPEQLMSAFQLKHWAKQNRTIFEDGRVVY